jgi:hypothetical protein
MMDFLTTAGQASVVQGEEWEDYLCGLFAGNLQAIL